MFLLFTFSWCTWNLAPIFGSSSISASIPPISTRSDALHIYFRRRVAPPSCLLTFIRAISFTIRRSHALVLHFFWILNEQARRIRVSFCTKKKFWKVPRWKNWGENEGYFSRCDFCSAFATRRWFLPRVDGYSDAVFMICGASELTCCSRRMFCLDFEKEKKKRREIITNTNKLF